MVFHAGHQDRGNAVGSPDQRGRVLTVAAMGKTIAEAREKAYNNVSRIHFDGCHYRKDIALFKS